MPREDFTLPLDVEDFTSDGVVEAMTTEEVGAYILLLCKSWREQPPGSIPVNDGILARWARLDPARWLVCKPAVLAAFTTCTDGRMVQKRAAQEYAKLRATSKRRSKAAETAACARWSKSGDAGASSDTASDSPSLELDDAKRMRNASESHCGRSPPKNDGVYCSPPSPNSSDEEIPSPTDTVRAMVLAVFAHYRTYHPRSHPSPTDNGKEWRKIAAMLKQGYSVDDLKRAIDGCHRSPWHGGENDRGKVYQSLELVVRDSSHVNEFMEIPERNAGAVLSEKTKRTMRAGDSYLSKRMGELNGKA